MNDITETHPAAAVDHNGRTIRVHLQINRRIGS